MSNPAAVMSPCFSAADAPGSSLWNLLQSRAEEHPQAVALRAKSRGLWRAESWVGWRKGAAQMAGALAGAGARQGDRVAVVLPEEPAWFHAALAIRGLGGTLVLLHEGMRHEQVLDWVKALDCKVVLTRRSDLLALASDPAFTNAGRHAMSPPASDALPGFNPSPLDAGADLFAIIVQPDALVVYATEGDLSRALPVPSNSFQAAAGRHLVVGCEIASLEGLAARLVLPLQHGCIACLPEPGGEFLETLRDVAPEIAIAPSFHWEGIWREVALRRLESASFHRWLFDRIAQSGPRAALSPMRLVQANLRRLLGLSRCRLAVATGETIAEKIAEWYGSFGSELVRSGTGAAPLECDLRSVPVVREAATRPSGAHGTVEVELTLDVEAALRFASAHGLDCHNAAALASDESLLRLVEADVRDLCNRRAGPHLGRLVLRVGDLQAS